MLLDAAWDLAPRETERFAAAARRVAELLGKERDMRAGGAGDLGETERELERAQEREAASRTRMGDEMERRMMGIERGGRDVEIGDSVYGPAFLPERMDGEAAAAAAGGAEGN